eukprot:33498_2
MEAGKLVQLLSLLNFPQTTEDDLVAWNEANQAIIGDYQGPLISLGHWKSSQIYSVMRKAVKKCWRPFQYRHIFQWRL